MRWPGTLSELLTIPTDTAPGATLAALWAAAGDDTARARAGLVMVRALPAERRRNLDAAVVLCEAWLAGAAGRPSTVVNMLRPVTDGEAGSGGLPVRQLTFWTVAQAFERIQQADSAAAWLERIAGWGGQVWRADAGLRGLTYSFVHFELGRLYTLLGRYNEAKEHYSTFLDVFTDPDPEYESMVTEARAKLEDLARGR